MTSTDNSRYRRQRQRPQQPHRRRGVLFAVTVLLTEAAAAPPVATVLPTAPSAATVLTIDGAVPLVTALTAAEFAALPRTTVAWTLHGKAVRCDGPWLADVLAAAGVASGEAVRGPALMTVVVATAADGYRAAFTLGELDHGLGNAAIVVADRCDGTALAAADGPLRLAAAGDRRGARSVRQLQRLTVSVLP